MSLTEIQKNAFDHAWSYPSVNHDDFDFHAGSYTLRRNSDGEWERKGIDAQSLSITQNGGGIYLANARKGTPQKDISFLDEDGVRHSLQQRVALLGIGSNSSSKVLQNKFKDVVGQQDIVVVQTKIPNHIVAHSAFMTEQGGVAVTLHPSEDGYSQATIGFYTEDLANQLTGTEPNYDGVALDLYAETPKEGVGIDNPLAYVSVWGALTQNGQAPVGTTHIPNSASSTMSTLEAIEFCRTVTNSKDSLEVFMEHNITNDDLRQQRTAMLQTNFTLPASIKGEQVFRATKAGEHQVPAIEYRPK